ncbi:MAG: hypothetical protein AAGK97_05105 [Bacteroidota bacterium]
MNKENLKQQSTEDLKKKVKDLRVFIIIFVALILGLGFFGIRDYVNGETNTPVTIITICTIGGLISLLPNFKILREELRSRD